MWLSIIADGQGDGVEIACDMRVHFFPGSSLVLPWVIHGHDLGIATARAAAFHAKGRTKRGLADKDTGVLADMVQPVAQPNGGGVLPYPAGVGVMAATGISLPSGRSTLATGPNFRDHLSTSWLGRETAHLEIVAADSKAHPILATGYGSHFVNAQVFEDASGPVADVEAWLAVVNDGTPKQVSLFDDL